MNYSLQIQFWGHFGITGLVVSLSVKISWCQGNAPNHGLCEQHKVQICMACLCEPGINFRRLTTFGSHSFVSVNCSDI